VILASEILLMDQRHGAIVVRKPERATHISVAVMPMEYIDYTHTVGAVPRHYVLRNQQRPTGLRRLVSLYGHVDMNGQLLYPATKTIVRLEWVQECFRAGALLPTDQWEIR
jgi:hypothetical protein